MRTLGVLLFLFGACTPAPPATFEPMELLAGQCHWVADTCHIDESTDLVLFLPDTGLIEATIDQKPMAIQAEPFRLGTQIVLPAPVSTGRFEIVQHIEGQVRRDGFPVARPPAASSTLQKLMNYSPGDSGCLEAVAGVMNQVTEEERGAAHEIAARCAKQAGKQDLHIEQILLSKQAHQVWQQTSLAGARSAVLALRFLSTNRLQDALRALDFESNSRDGDGHWIKNYYLARALEQQGRIQQAIATERRAYDVASAVQLSDHLWKTQNTRAIRADALGDSAEAIRILENADPGDDCYLRWAHTNNMQWYQVNLAARTSDLSRLSHIRQTLGDLEKSECWDQQSYSSSLRIDQARAAILAEDTPHAGRLLEELDVNKMTAANSYWYFRLKAKHATQIGRHTQSSERWREALRAARRLTQPVLEVGALGGLARAEAELGMTTQAAKHFALARELVERSALGLAFDTERGAWFDAHEQLTGSEALFWLAQSDETQMANLLREARQQRLGALAGAQRRKVAPTADWLSDLERYENTRSKLQSKQQKYWQVPVDQATRTLAEIELLQQEAQGLLGRLLPSDEEIEPPEAVVPGELRLLWWRLEDGRLLAIGTDGIQVIHEVLKQDSSDRALLYPFQDQIKAARSIKLLPPSSLSNRDLHATSIAGKPLIEWAPVSWSLDLSTTPSRHARRSFVVGNPTNDLPEAHTEAMLVGEAWGVRPAVSGQATLSAVIEGLSSASVAHLASHGGPEGLKLSDGTLTPGDILALPRVPNEVYLSGCETGAGTYGLGLAQAFVLAGSQAVVGTIRPVSDIDSTLMVKAWLAQASGTPAARLANAQQAIAESHPDVDWAAWRIWTP